MSDQPNKTLLVISQVYVPDPASVGQHMHDAAEEMARRGWRVIVYASARGYDDPSRRYPRRETRDGVLIRRLPLSSFGKHSMVLRLLAALLFMLQCMVRGLFVSNLRAVLVTTSPPMCSFAAVVIGALRRASIKFWVMDLNPDQLIALGDITERSLPARVFNWFNRLILRRADDVIALDRFMADRLNRKVDTSHKMHVMPPWPHEGHLEVVAHADNPFRREHGLENKFVVMYSGNHGLTTRVNTVLDAALRLQDDHDLVFMFIGGGHGKQDVERVIAEHNPPNIRSLPYQPLDRIKYSLSAADLHLVTMSNDATVGCIHPCKIYGAMAVARPILFIGPDPSHVTDIIREHRIGWQVANGDVDGAVEVIRKIKATDPAELQEMGRRARQVVEAHYSMATLRARFCDALEDGRAAKAQPAGAAG